MGLFFSININTILVDIFPPYSFSLFIWTSVSFFLPTAFFTITHIVQPITSASRFVSVSVVKVYVKAIIMQGLGNNYSRC